MESSSNLGNLGKLNQCINYLTCHNLRLWDEDYQGLEVCQPAVPTQTLWISIKYTSAFTRALTIKSSQLAKKGDIDKMTKCLVKEKGLNNCLKGRNRGRRFEMF